MIEGDVFRIIVKVPEFSTTGEESGTSEVKPQVTSHVAPQITDEVTGEVTPEVTPEVRLLTVFSGEMTRQSLQSALKLRDDEHFRKAYLLPALQAGFIEMTIPAKPRSSKRKYRLTDKGRQMLMGIKEGDE